MAKRSVTLGMEPSLLTNKNGFFMHSILSKKETIQKKTKKKKHNERKKKHEKLPGREKTRNKKLSSSQIFKTKEQINIRESAQRTSWLAMAKSNPRRSRRRRRTKRGKETATRRKAAGAFNPKTGFEIPNLKLGPRTRRLGTEPPALRRRL
jgi:hypothetical protein